MTLVEHHEVLHASDAPAAEADGKAGGTIVFESVLSTKAGQKVGMLEGHRIQIRADGTLLDCDVTV